jgi:hypothetical protein
MTTPSTRTPVRVARGTYANLNASILDLLEGEACYATDQNKIYVVEGGVLVPQPFLEAADIGVTVQGYDVTTLKSADIGATVQGYDATTLKSADIGTTVQAYDADTAKTDIAQSFTAAQRGEITTLTDAATIAVDFADSNNFTVTLGDNRTLGNPTNQVAGQSGSLFVVQDGTGSRTLAYSSDWEFAGGTAPTLSTAASAVDRIDYIVRASGNIHAVFTAAYS